MPDVLPPAKVPFPVESVYRIRPDMTRFGRPLFGEVQEKHFVLDRELPDYLEAKLFTLTHHPSLCRVLPKEHHRGLEEALWRVLVLVAEEHPSLVSLTDTGVTLRALGVSLERDGTVLYTEDTPLFKLGARVAAHLEGITGLARLADTLAFAVQEDVVIMRDAAEKDYAEALLVCFPSFWNPATQRGRSFAELHKPVAHSRSLVRAQHNVMKALFHRGPFVRFVWSLSPDARLEQNPERPREPLLPNETNVPNLTFRVERQTTLAMPALKRCLFSIRIFQAPLHEVLTTGERCERLRNALQSMDEALLAYKGLTLWREPLLDWLEPKGEA